MNGFIWNGGTHKFCQDLALKDHSLEHKENEN